MMILAAVCIFAAGAHAIEIKDMKSSHWAFDSVQKLVEKGYLAVYDDGTFRGDQPVSRVVLAAALSKLIDQIQSGELTIGGSDIAEIKKLSDAFKSEISDYDSRMEALEQRLGDIESGKIVIQQDISKSVVEFRGKFEKMNDRLDMLNQDINVLTEDINVLNKELEKERSSRKKAQNMLWIGVVAAIAVGAASN